jgi:ribonuclease H / adenosylcobalamin/alpha-ribazole phosphatase
VVTDERGRVLGEVSEGIGVATNNVAEYRAAIAGLSMARDLGAGSVLLRSDSKLLIEQLAGRFRVKNPTLVKLHREARALAGSIPGGVAFQHVRRERNREADRLANRGVDAWLSGAGAGFSRPEPAPELFPGS